MNKGCPSNSTNAPLKSINFAVEKGTKIKFNQFAFIKSNTSKRFKLKLNSFRNKTQLQNVHFQTLNQLRLVILLTV